METNDLDELTLSEFKGNEIGNYIVGHNERGKFIPTYVGKGNLKDRLTKHLKDEYNDKLFAFTYRNTIEEASKAECKDYHVFKRISEGGTLKNKIHPTVPDGEKCTYPGCNHVGGNDD